VLFLEPQLEAARYQQLDEFLLRGGEGVFFRPQTGAIKIFLNPIQAGI
jgi:hypothetical protein